VRGVIRSAERMTYTNVHLLLEGDEGQRERYRRLVPRFELMKELAEILMRRRFKRGSLDFDLPEPIIEFDESGMMTGISRAPRNIAHRIIEEFMLAANEAVAGRLEAVGIPSIYRVHEPPNPTRVAEFEQLAASFGYSLGVGQLPVKRFRMVDRKSDGRKVQRELLLQQNIEVSSRMYQKLVARIQGKPEERILSYLMLRSLKQARYAAENVGHFALAAKTYTHFTSPIRRYPDLMVHRILSWLLDRPSAAAEAAPGAAVAPEAQESKKRRRKDRGEQQASSASTYRVAQWDLEELTVLAEECSQTERRAAEAERELVEWKKVKFMIERVGDEFDALIISTTRFGFFVELEELFVEGLVPIETLPRERFHYHESVRKIIGERSRREFSIGDRVRVRLDRGDGVERKLQFSLVEPEAGKRKKRGREDK
jgi:ribonuclease R